MQAVAYSNTTQQYNNNIVMCKLLHALYCSIKNPLIFMPLPHIVMTFLLAIGSLGAKGFCAHHNLCIAQYGLMEFQIMFSIGMVMFFRSTDFLMVPVSVSSSFFSACLSSNNWFFISRFCRYRS